MSFLKQILDFYIFFGIIVFLIAIFFFIKTRKYKRNKITFLGAFLDLNKKQCLQLATITLNFIMSIYCVIRIQNFGILFAGMFATNIVISMIISLDIYQGFAELLYGGITILILFVMNLIHSFITNVSFDRATQILCISLGVAIVVYTLYITIRKLELMYKKIRVRGSN